MGYEVSFGIRKIGNTAPMLDDGIELGNARYFGPIIGEVLYNKLNLERVGDNPYYTLIPKDKFIEAYEIISSMQVKGQDNEEYRLIIFNAMTKLFAYLDTHEIWYVYE